jgi:hypothetical protein
MSYNWAAIGDKIYGILSSSGYGIQMWDDTGKTTIDPHDAIRFLASVKSKNPKLQTFNILIGLHDEDAYSHLDFRTPKSVDDADFETITALKNSIQKNLGDVEGLKINWTPFGSAITLKDDPIEKVTESRDIGKVYGTTKSSFQNVGRSKIIVRHSDPIDESKQGSRWRKIRSVFIETKEGERFIYPRAHIAGARALARHLSEGGNVNDDIAKGISEMSEDYMQLKRAGKLLRKGGNHDQALHAREAMKTINFGLKRISGNRGYHSAGDIIAKNTADKVKDKADSGKQLLTDCEGLTEDDMGCLNTAANYIIRVQAPVEGNNNACPTWLSPMLKILIDKLGDQEHIDRVTGMANDVDAGTAPNPIDIQWVVKVIKDINNPPVVDSVESNGQLTEDTEPLTSHDGAQEWYDDEGELHREDGPARITKAGTKEWSKHGKRHRIDGPAVMQSNGRRSYWVNGIYLDSTILKFMRLTGIRFPPKPNQELANDLDTEKQKVIHYILTQIKYHLSPSIALPLIYALKVTGVHWPELNAIEKSANVNTELNETINFNLSRIRQLSGI